MSLPRAVYHDGLSLKLRHGPCGDDTDTDDEWLDCEDWWVFV